MNAAEAQSELQRLTQESKRLNIFKEQPTKHIIGRAALALSRALVNGRANLHTFAHDPANAHDEVLRHAILAHDPGLLKSAVGVIDSASVAPLISAQIGETIHTIVPTTVLLQLNARDIDVGELPRLYPRLKLTAGAAAQWIGEGMPIPAVAATSEGITVTGSKCGAIVNVSSELFERADAAGAVESLLLASASKAINIASMSNAAAAPPVPAGLFGPWASAPIATSSMANDVNALAAALTQYYPMSGASYIMHPSNLNKLAQSAAFAAGLAHSGTVNGAKVIASVDVPIGRVGLVYDAEILRSLTLDPSSVQVSDSATVHSDDAPALDVMNASPTFSIWQRDMKSIRCVVFAAWASLHVEAVQHVEGASWS
jgi:HK97 family phage major capsid protein